MSKRSECIVFLACSGMMLDGWKWLAKRFENRPLNELRSYFEMTDFTGHTLPQHGGHYFLDSGAFSAWSRGWPIDVETYGRFLQKYGHQLETYANLDAIPKKRDAAGCLAAAEETWKNQLILEGMGLTPIPVFHKGEPWEFLQRYLDRGDPYICLGGLTLDASSGKNAAYFDEIWGDWLTNPDGTPKCKIHGFGMTSLKLMRKYPWYSCDSSAWLIHSKTGSIWFPLKKDGVWDFNQRPDSIGISDKSGVRGDIGFHFDNSIEARRENCLEWLAHLDVPLEGVRDKATWRFVVNLEYWIHVQEIADFTPTFFRRQTQLPL